MAKLTPKKHFTFETWEEAKEAYYSFPIHNTMCVKDPDEEEAKIVEWLNDNDLTIHD